MNFTSLFVDPRGRTSTGPFVRALIVLVAAAAFYTFLVGGLTAWWCLVVLLYPGAVLHARRLHDMGQTGWLVLLPLALNAAALFMRIYKWAPDLKGPVTIAALAAFAAFAVWGLLGKGQAEANRYGEPAAA